MKKLFTQQGLNLKQKQIAAQEARVRSIGREVGEEAGINCDWHDNFGYEDASRRLQMESSTLMRLKEEVSGAEIIEVEEQNKTVRIGVTAEVRIEDNEKKFTIGAYGESDPTQGLVSYTSPLGKSLIGMQIGDVRVAEIGGKRVALEIVNLFPPSYRYHDLIQGLVMQDR